MRATRLACLYALLIGSTATVAQAGTLTSATWFQIISDTSYHAYQYSFPMTRTAAQLGASGSSTASSISVALSYPQLTTAFFVPKTPNQPVSQHVTISQGGSQALTATPSMAAAVGSISGKVGLQIYSLGFSLPLRNGIAGQNTRTLILGGVTHSVTTDFYGWTAGTLTFTGLTSFGMTLPSVVAMGSFDLSAAGGGTVTLVSPTRVSIQDSGGGLGIFGRNTVRVSTLKLTFVPEPSSLLLIAAGAAALALSRRRPS